MGIFTIAKYAFASKDGIIKFYCGGYGNVVHSIYTGFYRSENDTPYLFTFADESAFTETEPGCFEWSNDAGTKIVKTQRIRENWFYYYVYDF